VIAKSTTANQFKEWPTRTKLGWRIDGLDAAQPTVIPAQATAPARTFCLKRRFAG